VERNNASKGIAEKEIWLRYSDTVTNLDEPIGPCAEAVRKTADEINAIEAGKRYRSAAEMDAFVEEIWRTVKDMRSDFVFEITDCFRISCNGAARDGVDRTSCEILAMLHQMFARKMVDSEAHRNFLFRRFMS
jgi:hypothetical protein